MQEKNRRNLAKIVIIFLGIFTPSFIFLGLLQGPIYSATSDTVNLQGKIVRNDAGYEGLNVTDGYPACVAAGSGNDTCDFRIRYYDASTAGNLLLTEQFSNIEIGQYVGVFNLALGSDLSPTAGVYTSLSDLIQGEDDVYVEVGFDPAGSNTYTEVFTRMPLQATGYAIRAKHADTATGATELPWSGLKDPTADLSLEHSTYTTLFNWATGTGTNDLFSLTSDASATGTGALMNIQTGTGSSLIPFRVRSGATEAIYVNSTGNVGMGTTSLTYKLEVDGDTNLTTGGAFRIGGNSVLNATTLGTGVTGSSLTSVGTLVSGIWNATEIDEEYGGTGQTGYATGDILFASGANTLAKRAIGSENQVLTVDATGVPVWANAGAASSVPFSGITSGTNTTAAMVVGTGASLVYNGGTVYSGGINSNYLLGGTWASPGTIGSTAPNTGAFTTLSASTSVTTPLIVGNNGVAPMLALRPSVDNAAAIQFQNAAGTVTTFNVDTTNSRVGIGTTAPSTQFHTTGGVRFAGITTGTETTAVMADSSGNLSTRALGLLAFEDSVAGDNWGSGFWTLAGDTGTQTINQDESATVAGGTGITTLAEATRKVTVSLDDTAVTLGSYGSDIQVGTFTVDQQGRLTAAGNTTIRDASGSQSGVVSTGAQTFAGAKTFSSTPLTLSAATAVLNFSSITGTKSITTGGTTHLNLNPGGSVGIGIAAPTELLHLSGGNVRIDNMTTAGIVMNDATGVLSGGNTIGSTNITTGNLVNGTKISMTGTLTDRLVDSGDVTVNLANSAALSVIGNATNASAAPSDIVAGSDFQVLRRSGTSIGFGAINLASSNAVTGILADDNGGTGQNTYAKGDILFASGANTLAKRAIGSENQVLTVDATGVPVWANAGAASSVPFSGITTGTNTTATMTVGTGGSLTYANSGTINASSLQGGTWASPGTIGSTTPNTGAFTTLSASTSVTTPVIVGNNGVAPMLALRPSVDNAAAIQFRNAANTVTTLNVDTTNSRVGIGTTAPSTQFHTTGGVRLAGITTGTETTAVMADSSGNLSTRALGSLAFDSSLAFLDLTDVTETSYVGSGGQLVAVNAGATGLEFVSSVPASTVPFSGITTGTNTSATMTVDTGASLGFANSGTINASSLLSGTWASPGAIGSTAANTGAFTTLSASTSVTTPLIVGNNGVAPMLALRPSVDNAAAIQFQNAAGTVTTFNVDTTNSRVGIGTTAPSTQFHTTGGVRLAGITTGTETTAVMADSSGNLSTRALGSLAFEDSVGGDNWGTGTWTLAGDLGTSQTISQDGTATISGDTGITTTAGATGIVSVDLDDTAVTLGSYGDSITVGTFTVDQQGRLTAAGNTTIRDASATLSGVVSTGAQTFAGAKTFSATPLTLSADSAVLSFSSITGTKSITTGGTTHLNLAPGGNVGIGIAAPAYKLDVSDGTGIVGRFSGRVIGADAVNTNEFVTKSQLDAIGGTITTYWQRSGTELSPVTSGDSVVPSGTASIGSSTLRWNTVYGSTGNFTNLAATTLTGAITGNSQDITGLDNLTGATSTFSTSISTASIIGIGGGGSNTVALKPASNAYHAVSITNATDIEVLTVDTINNRVGIGLGDNVNPSTVFHTNGGVRFEGISTATESTAVMADSSGNLSTRVLGLLAFEDNVSGDNWGSQVVEIDSNNTLTGDGTLTTPLSLNLANVNTWTGAQTFDTNTYFPGSGIWDSSGNVGIGTQTPGSKLHVSGSSTTLVNLGDTLYVDSTNKWVGVGGTPDTGFHIQKATGGYNQTYITNAGTTNAENQLWFSTGYGDVSEKWAGLGQIHNDGSLRFTADGSLSTPHMTLLPNGNFGIGTVSPSSKLTLYGSSTATTVGGFEVGMRIANTNTTTNNWQSLVFGDTAKAAIEVKNIDHTNDYGDIALTTRAADGWLPRMYIQSAGNVGIGNSAPASLFSVGATSQFQVDTSGDITKIKNLSYTWPTAHTTDGYLQNNGTGGLSWAEINAVESTGTPYGSATEGPLAFWTSSSTISAPTPYGLYWDDTNQYLGIGTNTPSAPLDIAGGTGGSLIKNSSGDITIEPAEDLIISQGNVGIGTTNPLAKLHVKGNQILLKNEADADIGFVLDSGSTTTYRDVINFRDRGTDIFALEKTATNAFQLYDYAGTGVSRILVEAGINSGISFRTKGTGDFSFINDTTTMVTIDETGKVGIGTTTPAQQLDVAGDLRVGGREIFFDSDTSGDYMSSVTLQGLTYYEDGAAKWKLGSGTSVSSYINNGGRFGIGDDTPDFTLDVEGSVAGKSLYVTNPGGVAAFEIGYGATSSQNAYIDLKGDTTYIDYGLRIIRWNDGANANSEIAHRGTGNLKLNTVDPGGIVFSTAGTTRMTIGSGGQVGIGTDPVSTATLRAYTANGSNVRGFISNMDQAVGTDDNFFAGTRVNASTYAWVDTEFKVDGGGAAYTDGGWNGSADYAEYFYTNNRQIEKGDLVSLIDEKSPTGVGSVEKASNNNRENLVGIISTNPGFIGALGDDTTEIGDYYATGAGKDIHRLVSMLGQAPVKVSTENGEIQINTPISTSSLSGIGSRSTKAGYIVGRALEPFIPTKMTCVSVNSVSDINWPEDLTGTNSKKTCFKLPDGTYVGKIMMYVSSFWYDPKNTAVKDINSAGWYKIASLNDPTGDYARFKINNTTVGSSQNVVLSVNIAGQNESIDVTSNIKSGGFDLTKARINKIGETKYLEVYLPTTSNNKVRVSIDGDPGNWSVTDITNVATVGTSLKEYDFDGPSFSILDKLNVLEVGSNLTPTTSGMFTLGSNTARWGDIYTQGTINIGGAGDNGGIKYNTETNRLEFSNDGQTWVPLGSSSNTELLSAQYPGSIALDGIANTGEMTMNNTGIGNTSMNYYQWESSEIDLNSKEISIRYQLPSNFKGWGSGGITLSFATETTDVAQNVVDMYVYEQNSVSYDGISEDNTSVTSGEWTTTRIEGSQLNMCNEAEKVCIIKVQMSSSLGKYVRVGDIKIKYERTL